MVTQTTNMLRQVYGSFPSFTSPRNPVVQFTNRLQSGLVVPLLFNPFSKTSEGFFSLNSGSDAISRSPQSTHQDWGIASSCSWVMSHV